MTLQEQQFEAAMEFANKVASGNKIEAVLGFGHGIEWERQRDKWISVKDQLPPPEDANSNAKTSAFVLVYDWKYGMHNGFFMHGYGYWNDRSDTITHWQSLPEPPKQ